jgi:hypothetical protein
MRIFWCFLYRCNDCIPLPIIIIFKGREHIRIPFDWPNFARCTRHRGSLLRLLWQNSMCWHLNKSHNVGDLSALILCYKTREQMFVGNNRGVEGIDTTSTEGRDATSTESWFNVGWFGALSRASVKMWPDLCLVRVQSVMCLWSRRTSSSN